MNHSSPAGYTPVKFRAPRRSSSGPVTAALSLASVLMLTACGGDDGTDGPNDPDIAPLVVVTGSSPMEQAVGEALSQYLNAHGQPAQTRLYEGDYPDLAGPGTDSESESESESDLDSHIEDDAPTGDTTGHPRGDISAEASDDSSTPAFPNPAPGPWSALAEADNRENTLVVIDSLTLAAASQQGLPEQADAESNTQLVRDYAKEHLDDADLLAHTPGALPLVTVTAATTAAEQSWEQLSDLAEPAHSILDQQRQPNTAVTEEPEAPAACTQIEWNLGAAPARISRLLGEVFEGTADCMPAVAQPSRLTTESYQDLIDTMISTRSVATFLYSVDPAIVDHRLEVLEDPELLLPESRYVVLGDEKNLPDGIGDRVTEVVNQLEGEALTDLVRIHHQSLADLEPDTVLKTEPESAAQYWLTTHQLMEPDNGWF